MQPALRRCQLSYVNHNLFEARHVEPFVASQLCINIESINSSERRLRLAGRSQPSRRCIQRQPLSTAVVEQNHGSGRPQPGLESGPQGHAEGFTVFSWLTCRIVIAVLPIIVCSTGRPMALQPQYTNCVTTYHSNLVAPVAPAGHRSLSASVAPQHARHCLLLAGRQMQHATGEAAAAWLQPPVTATASSRYHRQQAH
jgi:hypothetical protein